MPSLRAADQGVASALESVLADNTQRVYQTQWRLFTDWCGDVGLRSLPAEPLTVARYLAARAHSGASIATMRLVVHQFWIDGYKDFNFMRASAVVKRQSTFMAS